MSESLFKEWMEKIQKAIDEKLERRSEVSEFHLRRASLDIERYPDSVKVKAFKNFAKKEDLPPKIAAEYERGIYCYQDGENLYIHTAFQTVYVLYKDVFMDVSFFERSLELIKVAGNRLHEIIKKYNKEVHRETIVI